MVSIIFLSSFFLLGNIVKPRLFRALTELRLFIVKKKPNNKDIIKIKILNIALFSKEKQIKGNNKTAKIDHKHWIYISDFL